MATALPRRALAWIPTGGEGMKEESVAGCWAESDADATPNKAIAARRNQRMMGVMGAGKWNFHRRAHGRRKSFHRKVNRRFLSFAFALAQRLVCPSKLIPSSAA